MGNVYIYLLRAMLGRLNDLKIVSEILYIFIKKDGIKVFIGNKHIKIKEESFANEEITSKTTFIMMMKKMLATEIKETQMQVALKNIKI